MGGVVRVRELADRGWSRGAIRSAIARGELVPVRIGWVRTLDAAPALVDAVKARGRLACVSAARHLGLWTPEANALHVALPVHTGHHQTRDLVVHWVSNPWRENSSPIEPLAEVLRQVSGCCDHDFAITVFDSALNQGQVTLGQLSSILADAPAHTRALIDEVDSRSESGLESLCRVRLRRARLPVRSQVLIPGVGRVDLIVGDRLIIETDGRAWHSRPDAFDADRSRDLALTRMGYLVLRLSARHVIHEWQWVERVILEIVRRREHLWTARHNHAGG